jgi:hypothetical protein
VCQQCYCVPGSFAFADFTHEVLRGLQTALSVGAQDNWLEVRCAGHVARIYFYVCVKSKNGEMKA